MTSYYCHSYIELLTTILNNFGLYILFLHDFIINITILWLLLLLSLSFITSFIIFINVNSEYTSWISNTLFYDLFLGLSSLIKAFIFNNIYIFNGYFTICFTFFYHFSIYDWLVIITCFIYKAQTLKYFVLSRLYLIKIFF